MDLITLNSSYQPSKLVDNYNSLIWTERFNTVGEFELITPDISGGMTTLPEGTLVSLRESNVAMVVETHHIERKKNTGETLKIKGRSFESILDRRVAMGAMSAADWLVSLKTPSDAAHYIINQICVAGILSANDIFPSSKVQFPTPSDYNTSTGPVRSFNIPRGNLLTAVLGLLQTEAPIDISTTPDTEAVVQHGIRAIRPSAAGTAVGIEIYKGVDRTNTIVFDGTKDALDDGAYLFSKVGSASTAYLVTSSTSATMEKEASAPSGLDRRVILVDATGATDTSLDSLKALASQSLTEARETAMFDGSINEEVNSYTYGVDYNLGDIVRLSGDYGLFENARVTEYIRSKDATGVKSYPTLSTVQ